MGNNENLMIKIPTELKEKLKETAKDQFQTVSVYIRDLIVKDLKEKNKWK